MGLDGFKKERSVSGILLTFQGWYALRPDVAATVMGDGAVLLDLRTKYFYSANRTAWAVLAAFEEGAEVSAVAQACRECVNGAAGGHEAIRQFLEQLMAEDLLEPLSGPGAASAGSWKDALTALGGAWVTPTLVKHKEPLQRVMISAFDPSMPLAE